MSPEHLVQAALAYVLALIAAVVWFVRLEGRVNLLDRVLMDAMEARKDTDAIIRAQMTRIEQKVDRIMIRCAAAQHLIGRELPDSDEQRSHDG